MNPMQNLSATEKGPVVGKPIAPQTLKKVVGEYRYVDDITGDFLHGYVLRANIPHGIIRGMDVSAALRSQGVKAVLTSKDVPGLNAFGYFKPEQPVLCFDRIRYEGDAVVAIAADSQEHAIKAAEEVKLAMDALPVIDTIDDALKPGAANIHDGGNIAYTADYEKGNFQSGLSNAWKEFEGSYKISPVKPMYIELESTIATSTDGAIRLVTTTQSPYHDKVQVSRILNVPMDKIWIESIDPGGAFGGKEEIHTQALASLLSMKTGQPVKLTLTREESGKSTTRRHGFIFHIKSGITKAGSISGLYIKAVGDTGAYISHGPGVLKVSGSHSAGPYFVPNVKFDGMLVYTNKPPSGGMRGYGASEVNFALERHIDEVCKELKFDPFEFRMINAIKEGQTDGTGVVPAFSVKAIETMEEARGGALWRRPRGTSPPYKRVGFGVASGAKSTSYGLGGDSAKVMMNIKDGVISIYFNTPDMGTHFRTGLAMMAADFLKTSLDLINIKNESSEYPESGTQNASRSTFMLGNAMLRCAATFKSKAISLMSGYPDFLDKDILLSLERRGGVQAEAQYILPVPEGGVFGKSSDAMYSFITTVVRVEVDELTGTVKVTDIEAHPEAGAIINPLEFKCQMEGGIIMSMGYAIMEDLKSMAGKLKASNFTTYILPCVADIPIIAVLPVNNYEPLGPYGAKGAGELSLVSVTPAIINAIVDATGKDIHDIPASIENMIVKF